MEIVMNYFTITSIIMNVLLTLLGLLTVHFVIFAFIGLFTRKTFPKTDKKLKYGIIIPARNEETVVCNLIESIYKCNYPQEKLHVFVIAHNCTDKTADVARAAELGISQEQLNRWLGRGDRYFAQAGATGHTEPRKTAKLHIFMGLLEKLIARANFNLSDDMRPYDRKK